MVMPRDGEMNYEKIDELGFYYMFVGSCLSERDYTVLKTIWEEKGGREYLPWWKFIMENTKVALDIQ